MLQIFQYVKNVRSNPKRRLLRQHLLVVFISVLMGSTVCQAQFGGGDKSNDVSRFSEAIKQKWQFGAVIQAGPRGASSVNVSIPVPTDWPEQTVALVAEDNSTSIGDVKYSMLDDGVRLMNATIPRIGANSAVKVLVTFEVQVNPINLPENAANLAIPAKPNREIKKYLNSSPLIDHRKSDLKKVVGELTQETKNPWTHIESFHQWIQDNIETNGDVEPKGSTLAIKNKHGNDEDKVNVFVAMCRSFKVPARIVWLDTSLYAEFYLEDESGNGAWYPCQPGANVEFGKMTHPEVIMQKGDNIKVPGGDRKRFVNEFVSGNIKGAMPEIIFVHRMVPD